MNAVLLCDAERYVGMPYEAGVFDCASLAVLVQRELFGRVIALPGAARRPLGRRGHARAVASQALATAIDVPETGCGVLLWESTAFGVPPLNRSWHIGTVFVQGSAVWVLHNASELRGTVLQRLPELLHAGMHFEGFYQWI